MVKSDCRNDFIPPLIQPTLQNFLAKVPLHTSPDLCDGFTMIYQDCLHEEPCVMRFAMSLLFFFDSNQI